MNHPLDSSETVKFGRPEVTPTTWLYTLLQMSEKDSSPLLGAKSSPRTENKGEETFDYMPRTAKSAFTGR